MRHHHKSRALACALLAACAAAFAFGAVGSLAQVGAEQNAAEFVSVAELKEKLAKNEPVTLIDLRSANVFASSDGKIAGAVHVKERRLRARLAQPPLRDLPRDAEVVTYCACPNDEAAVRAAQTLSSAGFTRVRVLKGGWRAWLDARAPVEPKPKGQ
ncbi:MAG TPA: rhodanese-like domain-containing protein [Pyrinomonadaceae bacterium]